METQGVLILLLLLLCAVSTCWGQQGRVDNSYILAVSSIPSVLVCVFLFNIMHNVSYFYIYTYLPLLQPHVLTYPHQQMETLTMMVDSLTADLLIPLLPSFVTLATLSLEAAALGPVGVMECGVGQLQHVSVSKMDFVLFVC